MHPALVLAFLLSSTAQDAQLTRDLLDEQGNVLNAEDARAKEALAQRRATEDLYLRSCTGKAGVDGRASLDCDELFATLRHRAIVAEVASERMQARPENVSRYLANVRRLAAQAKLRDPSAGPRLP